ncbi:MAG: family 1 encapsulin nanocompartment shell protein [Bacillota bacterium]|nr:family 1 encapsulin nanocompartment shell protein [Bacillota bacterium]
MKYLLRDDAPITTDLWKKIDEAVVKTAQNVLTGRRFLHLFGPLGIGVTSINVDDSEKLDEVVKDGYIRTVGRKFVAIPALYDDFTLFGKDLEYSEKNGYPVDLSKVITSAETCALKEDRLIFFGHKDLGCEGLLTEPGTQKIKRNDWSTGEFAFTDVAAAIQLLTSKGIYGTFSLAVSPDLYLQMQRIQHGTGMLEIERIGKLLKGNIYNSPVLGKSKAVLVCADPRYMDLVIGQDMTAAFLESVSLNHNFRILETLLLRIKRKEAIVVFE